MANYSTDADLVKIAPKILNYGVSSWTDMHTRAAEVINRTLEQKWYRPEASHRGILYEDTPFDSDLLDPDQLVWLSCYLVLSFVYQYLMKPGATEDFYERQMKLFEAKYTAELNDLLKLGITYNWDEDEDYDEDERIVPRRRRLRRS